LVFLIEYKWLDVLLEAFHLFAQNHPDTSLLIVGNFFIMK